MSELHLAIVECRYPDQVQDELLKDQYIFSLGIKEIQDQLLGEIVTEDPAEKCLLESCKVELKIEKRKLLGIKMSMMYDAIHRSRNKSRRKGNGKNRSNSTGNRNCRYCGKSHSSGNCPAFGKKCQKCGKDNHFKVVCKSSEKCNTSRSRPKKPKGKKLHEINEKKDESMDDLADQVQSLFNHNIYFNSIDTRIIDCRTPDEKTSMQTFKVDTGADGNLMPITMFTKLFPKVSLDALGKTVETGVTLFAYNYTPIRQFRTCSVRLSFKGKLQFVSSLWLNMKQLLLELQTLKS